MTEILPGEVKKRILFADNIKPRDYQDLFHADALMVCEGDREHVAYEQRKLQGLPTNRHLYSAPTGTGKSVLLLRLHTMLPYSVCVTPRLEIVRGFLEKAGFDKAEMDNWSDNTLAGVALEYGITTPIRFRNMLAKGTFPYAPSHILLDEAHHDLADTYDQLRAYLGDHVIWIGVTATAYRGTQKGTAKFLEAWGGVTEVINIRQATERGYIAIPTTEVWPLVDDDLIEVKNGEFVATANDAAAMGSLALICSNIHAKGWVRPAALPAWDRATLFAAPTTASCRELTRLLNENGLPAECVLQDTPRAERNRIFKDTIARKCALVQIDVVSEGVDLPFRRLIDLRPTQSPNKWMQQIGRETRPVASERCNLCAGAGRISRAEEFDCGPAPRWEEDDSDEATATPQAVFQLCQRCWGIGTIPVEPPPEYYCCNRNLERHGYLFEGALPSSAFRDAQQAFNGPTKRSMSRAVGLENIGRFAAIEVPYIDGCIGQMYQLVAVDKFKKTEYAAVVHPASHEILYAQRTIAKDPDTGELDYKAPASRWRLCESLPELNGFSSAPQKALSEKQIAWWVRSAATHGLDPRPAKINTKNFAALPIFSDLKVKPRM